VGSETKREGAGAPLAATVRFDPVPGTVIAKKYRVDRTLGEGGMGLVVAATHLGLEQEVAIKFLLPEAMRSEVAVERFLREAKVAAKIRSDHVARVHDVGTLDRADGGVPYIVMEHLEGSDLGQLIERDGPLPIEEACEIVLQACEGLAEVHAAGIVHRDLKPSNLFVTRKADGSPAVKLLDFGISKLTLVPDGSDPALTATATIMGSPSYMSPEQLKSTKEVDDRTDVWSLGAVLYEAVTGAPAFRGETLPQVCAMIASEDPAPPSTRRDGVPAELETAILHCLDKNPRTRQTLVELARSLTKLAPARGKASLERIEATIAASGSRRAGELPALGLAPSLDRTRSSRRKDGGGSPAGRGALFLLVVCGTVALAVYGWRERGKEGPGDAAAVAPSRSHAAASVAPPGSSAPSASAAPSAAASAATAPSSSAAPSPSAHATPAPSAAPSKSHPTSHPHHAVKLHRQHS
jgi:serine/threonine-protein kinase